jgi:hypothetical protein
MSQPMSGGDVTTTADDLDQNLDGSIDSNDDYRIPKIDYEKGKIFLMIFDQIFL